MDSISQATLGAAVAQVVGGRQLGRWAPVWGLVIGTLPDLDLLLNPLFNSYERLAVHRGASHGLLSIAVAAVALGALLAWIHRGRIERPTAMALVAWVWGTHILIDLFNIYPTRLWSPISDAPVAFGFFFIVEPVFTVPLVVATLLALAWPRWPQLAKATGICLGVSTATVLLAIGIQQHLSARMRDELQRAGLTPQRLLTTPGPTLLLA
jgi:inner membrane protein